MKAILFKNSLLVLLLLCIGPLVAQTLSFEQQLRLEAILTNIWSQDSYAKKMGLLKEAAQIDSTNTKLIGIRAYVKQVAGYKKDALKDYNRYMETKPNSTYSLYRAYCKAELGDTAGAWRDLDKLMVVAGSDYRVCERLDNFYKKLGNMQRVANYYAQVLKTNPNNKTAWAVLGDIKSEQGNYAGAIANWEMVLKITNNELFSSRYNYRWIYWKKADAEFMLKRYDKAIESESQALLLYPDDKVLYKTRIDMYLAIGNQEKACADYWVLLKLQQKPYTSAYGTLNCESAKKYEPDADWKLKQEAEQNYLEGIKLMKGDSAECAKAIKLFTKTLRLQPNNLFALTCRSQCYTELGMDPEALADLQKAIRKKPASAPLLLRLAYAQSYVNQTDSAQISLDKAIALAPEDVETRFAKAEILRKQKKYHESINEYNKLLQLNTNIQSAYYSKSFVEMYHLKEYSAALNDINKAIEAMEDCPINYQYGSYYHLKARIYDRLGDYTNALEANAHAIALDPDNAEYYYNRGELKARMKDMAGACREWSKAESLGGRSRVAEVVHFNCGG